MSEPIVEDTVPAGLNLAVLKSGTWSYRVIFSDTRTLLQRCWPEILVTALFAPPILWMVRDGITRVLLKNLDYSYSLAMLLGMITRSAIEALWFVALAPALVMVRSKIEGKLPRPPDILRQSGKIALTLFLAGTIYDFVLNSGMNIPVLIRPIWGFLSDVGYRLEELIGPEFMFVNVSFVVQLILPMIIGFALASYLFFFLYSAVFQRTGVLESLRTSIRLIHGSWWKLSFLFLLMEPRFLLSFLIDIILPDYLSDIVWMTFLGTPLQVLAVGLSIIVFLNLLSIARYSRVCIKCGSEVSINDSELTLKRFDCPHCGMDNFIETIEPEVSGLDYRAPHP
ncbi:MAG: hypothetical protein IPH59_05610 [bacterium]|nr:hypothetical protein [bacterium]